MNKIKLSNLSHFYTALKLVFDCAPWLTVAGFFLTFIQSFFPLFIIYLIKELVDAVSMAVNAPDKALVFNQVLWIVAATGIAYLVNALANAAGFYLREHQSQLFADHMYSKLHRKAASLDLEFYETPGWHDMFYRALQDSPTRPVSIVNNVFYMLQYSLALLLLGTFLMFSLHWAIVPVLILATVPAGIIRLLYAEKMYNWQYNNTQNERKAAYYNRILTSEPFAKELRLFGLQDYFITAFTALREQLRKGRLSIHRKRLLLEIPAHIVAAVTVFGAFAWIAQGAVYGSLTIGLVVMYYMALQKGVYYFKDLLGSFTTLYEDNLYLENLNAFLKIENKHAESVNALPFPRPLQKGIVFGNVSFKYPNSKRQALSNINISIPAGSTVALVGDNGAGKTTLVKLLCGLYRPDSGDITIDGVNIHEMSSEALKANISVLFQDYVLYNLSLRENIGFGNIKNLLDQDKIKKAAQDAGAGGIATQLPQGYDTVLGKIFDNSEELSIGQWQKIAMARAFFRDASLVILDEPTSALDPKAERDVFEKFAEITHNKTAVIVSHRFSTVKMADYIYVLQNEGVAEHGTHNELMAANGIYARMYSLQASNYLD